MSTSFRNAEIGMIHKGSMHGLVTSNKLFEPNMARDGP